jgi:membrane associated rhomboid family serine protease
MTPWVTRLIVVNAALLLASMTFPRAAASFSLVGMLVTLRPWTLITYMFLHADIWHLVFNMLALFFFGPRLEFRLGGPRFMGLYFTSGVVAALVSVLVTPEARIVGASGAVFGVLLGFARFWPRDTIYIWGVLPIEARWLVIIMAGLSLYGGVAGSDSGIAHFAHLGGFLGGYLYFKMLERLRPGPAPRAPRPPVSSGQPAAAELERWTRIDRQRIHPVNRDELDRLMDKIRATGVGSLTPDERAFLDRFSAI